MEVFDVTCSDLLFPFKHALDSKGHLSLFQISRDLLMLYTLSLIHPLLLYCFHSQQNSHLFLLPQFIHSFLPPSISLGYAYSLRGKFLTFFFSLIFHSFLPPFYTSLFFLSSLLSTLAIHILNWRIRSRAQWYWESMEGQGWAHNMGQ